MKTPLSSKALKQHFTYSWWKYILLAIISFGLVNLLYTVTAYRSPEEKKIEFYVYGYINEQDLTDYMTHVQENEMPEMELMSPLMLLDDNNYGPMQLMTYLAAGEGDLYLLPREQFLTCVSSDALVPLDNDTELLELFNAAGVSLQNGWRKNTETGENHLYGIPQSKVPGLAKYAAANDGYLCVIWTGGNIENTFRFLRILCRDMLTAPQEEPSVEPSAEPAS